MTSSGYPKGWPYSSLKGTRSPFFPQYLLSLFQPACERDAATRSQDKVYLCYYDQVVLLTILRIFVALVNDYLTPHLYDATLAGLSYKVTTSYDGFSVCISGYNDKLGYLLERIMQAVHDLEIQQERFDIILEKVYNSHRTSIPMAYTPADEGRL